LGLGIARAKDHLRTGLTEGRAFSTSGVFCFELVKSVHFIIKKEMVY